MAYYLVALNEREDGIDRITEISLDRVPFYDGDAELRHHPYTCLATGEEETAETFLLVGPSITPEAAAAEYVAGEYIRDLVQGMAIGRLPREKFDGVSKHLTSCPWCRRYAEEESIIAASVRQFFAEHPEGVEKPENGPQTHQ